MSTPKPPTSPSLSKSAPSLPAAQDSSDLRRKALQLSPLAPDDSGQASTTESASQPQHRPAFNSPFFTLVEDATTSEHFHPTVHYIFSDDDDRDLLTEACLRALSDDAEQAEDKETSSSPDDSRQQQGRDSSVSKRSRSPTLLSPSSSPQETSKERYLIVDVGPSGDTITSVRSMTADWQALVAEVTNAPTWEATEGPKTSQHNGAGLMLRIEGTEGFSPSHRGRDIGGPDGGERDMSELVALFERRMATLRKVVDAGERTIRLG